MIDARFYITIFRDTGQVKMVPISLFRRYGDHIAPDANDDLTLPFSVKRGSSGGMDLELFCVDCQKSHVFNLELKSLKKKGGNYIYCPQCQLELAFVGAKQDVAKVVDRRNREIEALVHEMGLDDYFKNPLVTYDMINYIHDMAESKKIYCECGSHDITATVNFDKIELFCKKCGSSYIINTRDKYDLERAKKARPIIIKQSESPDKLIKY